jgi:heme/copper-type cytochrome/quinol oxidase subunit 2
VLIVPMVLGLLLLTKLSPRLSKLGNVSLAYLTGAGAAIAIGGAVMGTILTQTVASINLFDMKAAISDQQDSLIRLIEGVIVVIGTISTLVYFHFGAKKNPDQRPYRPIWLEGLSFIGRLFIAVTLGAIFAGVYLASLAAMIDRLDFIRTVINQILLIISTQA